MDRNWVTYQGSPAPGRRGGGGWRTLRAAPSVAAGVLLRWLRLAWLTAFPPLLPNGSPTAPGPLPPLAKSGALREGALLYEIDGEPVSKQHVA